MNKIKLIIKREYLTRVKKKSFVLMTLFGPLLMAGLMIIPVWIATKGKDVQEIEVIDETKAFEGQFENSKNIKFEYARIGIEQAKADFYNEKYTSILHITSTDKKSVAKMYYKKQPGFSVINKIENTIEEGIQNIELNKKFSITKEQLKETKPSVKIEAISVDDMGAEAEENVAIITAIGYAGAIMIYFFIFMYGIQIMRGVIEEKTSRIVEIIISSVKPVELMMGKIIGIALVGLTQFLSWILLTGIIYMIFMSVFAVSNMGGMEQMSQTQEMLNSQEIPEGFKTLTSSDGGNIINVINNEIDKLPIARILVSFLFYFLGGYLLYGALLAAIGSAVDSEADTQQFMLPVTIPLIFSFVMASNVMQNPDGPLAFWLSIFPLTSPIIMMIRIPFGVDLWELLLSMVLLIGGFIGTTFLAAKIYRTGILMYGKKITYKELWKWLLYKG